MYCIIRDKLIPSYFMLVINILQWIKKLPFTILNIEVTNQHGRWSRTKKIHIKINDNNKLTALLIIYQFEVLYFSWETKTGVLIFFVCVRLYGWTTWASVLLTALLMQVLRVISRLFIPRSGGRPALWCQFTKTKHCEGQHTQFSLSIWWW